MLQERGKFIGLGGVGGFLESQFAILLDRRLHHIGLSKRRRGTPVIVLINNLDIRVLHRHTGQLIRKLILDPTRDYQPRGVKCGNSPENRLEV